MIGDVWKFPLKMNDCYARLILVQCYCIPNSSMLLISILIVRMLFSHADNQIRRLRAKLHHHAGRSCKDVFLGRHHSRLQFISRRRSFFGFWTVVALFLFAVSAHVLLNMEIEQNRILRNAVVRPGRINSVDMHYIERTKDENRDDEIMYEVVIQYEYKNDVGERVQSTNIYPASSDTAVFSSREAADRLAALAERLRLEAFVDVFVVSDHSFLFPERSHEPSVLIALCVLAICIVSVVGTSDSGWETVPAHIDEEWRQYVPSLGLWMYELLDTRDINQTARGLLLLAVSSLWHLLPLPLLYRCLVDDQRAASFLVHAIATGGEIAALSLFLTGLRCLTLSLAICETSVYSPRRPYLLTGVLGNIIAIRHVLNVALQIRSIDIVLSLSRVDREVDNITGEERVRFVTTLLHEQSTRVISDTYLSKGVHVFGNVDVTLPSALPASSAYATSAPTGADFPRFVWRIRVVTVAASMPTHSKQVVVIVKDPSSL